MRSTGVVSSSRGLGRHDHVCWTYDDAEELRTVACDFLADGLADGERVAFVAPQAVGVLRDTLDGLPGVDAHVDRGALQLLSTRDIYPHVDGIDAGAQVAAYARATDAAISDGFTGFRVAAEATSLVRTRSQRDAFVRYEHLVDRYMTQRPFSALCAYHTDELGAPATQELACVHPLQREGDAAFFFCASEDHDAAVGGELDAMSEELFPNTLELVCPGTDGQEIVVDATGLAFVDHRALLALDAHADRRGTRVVLRGAGRMAARLAELLDLRHVTVA